eukprot:TRINITY_DN3663_c0_g1_i1.p2 TRINITY_DN3663_c0_g1~~TRINITY_DN3663_c0_g1_i1.p2  ORF type:complete len:372 (-),score=109.23 TRINITY_DN3663_c0_g1_i1:158-1273(-)
MRAAAAALLCSLALAACASSAAASCSFPLVTGGSGRSVYTIQYLLNYHGYAIGVDGIWGTNTKNAVMQFQTRSGLPADGMVGTNTWKALIVLTQLNDTGYQVKAVQDQLRYHYSYSVSIDGIFGTGTQNAVIGVQKSRGALANGAVDDDTWLDLLDDTCNTTTPAGGKTVAQAVADAGCSTAVCKGLSTQLVDQSNCIQSGLFSSISGMASVSLSSSAAAVPYLQTAAKSDLAKAVAQRGTTMTINSALRTLPQQLLLYQWYLKGLCGITAAASPGSSNHNGGAAVDINDADGWISAMQANHWTKLGSWDPPHYDYDYAEDVRSLSVKSFQQLWNINNPSDPIGEDGLYGPATEAAMLASPIDGFPQGATC